MIGGSCELHEWDFDHIHLLRKEKLLGDLTSSHVIKKHQLKCDK